MRHSLINPYDVRRYLNLWTVAVFDDDGDSKGGGDSGGGDDKPAPKNTIGSVSKTGQYAGDGFEWVDNGSGELTRTYTGANKDAGLGTDVRTGGTEDKAVKEAIATISLNEGSEFAGTQASVTDYDALDIFRSPENQTASSSFAEQVGVEDYTPTITYGDDAPTPQAKTFGEEFAEARAAGQDTFTYEGNLYTTELAPEITAPASTAPVQYFDAFGNAYTDQTAAAEADQTMAQQAATANEIVRGTEESLFEQPVVSESAQEYLDSLGTDFDFTQFDGPSIDYTVSQGEAGRGGPDSAAPTFIYEPGVDPAKEILVNLKNTAPETLSTSEYLIASEYEKQKGLDTTSPTSTVSVTPEIEVAGPVTQLPSSPDFAMPGTAQAAYATSGGPAEIGGEFDPRNILPTSEQMAAFEGTEQPVVDKTPEGNLLGDIAKSLAIGVPGEASQMFSGLQSYAQSRPNQYTGNLMLDAVQEIMLRLDPEKTQQAILSQTPEQAAQRGQGMGAASEFLGDVSTAVEDYFYPDRKRDLAVVTGTTPGELAIQDVQGEGGGAGLANVVAEETGGALGTDIPLAYMGVPGRLVSGVLNFGEQLAGGESTTRQALDVLEKEGVLQDNPVFKDALEKQGGNVEAAKDALVRANVFQSGPAIGGTGAFDAVVPGPGKGLLSIGKNILTRGGVEGAQEVAESSLALSSLNNLLQLPEEQKIGVFQDASGNAVMGMLTGGATTTVAAPITAAASAANQAITNKMNADAAAAQAGQFVPTSPTAGQVAQAPAGIESSYDQEAQGAATTMERVAAQEIIDNVKAEEGTVSPQILQNLQNATGLSMQELSDMASDSVVSLGNFNIDPAVGRPTASDLQDQPTGIGGGSNIAVEPLPSGDTLLRNNDTGRTTVVNQGEDLAAAIQTFDEVTTPFVDTRNPLQLTADMQVGVDDTGSRINFLPTEADQAPMMPTTTRDTDVDLSGIASRLNLTDAQSLGPTTPDLSGITSNITFQPTAADQAVTSKMDADAAATTDQTARVMEVLQNARSQQIAGSPQLVSKTGIQSLIDAGLVSEEAALTPMMATSAVTELLRLGPDEVKARMGSDVAAEVEVDETPVFTSVRADQETTETPVFSTVRDTDTTEDTIVELDETPVFTSVRGDTTTDTDEGVTVELDDDAQGELDLVQVEDRKTTIPSVTSTKPETTTATDETTDTDTTTEVKVLTETGDYPEPEEEPEVEVEPEVKVEPEVDDGIDVLVPPIVTTDEDGNTVTECPEGYKMIETANGPMCQKTVTAQRQRAGRGVQAYTGIVTKPGARGPGQRRITTTRTERVRPTTRSV